MTARLLVGDVRDRIRDIPDGSVDLVLSSPPFLALRKYGADDREMGSEANPAAFIDALLELTGEFRRVLAPHGSIAIELGDTYSGSGGAGGDYGETKSCTYCRGTGGGAEMGWTTLCPRCHGAGVQATQRSGQPTFTGSAALQVGWSRERQKQAGSYGTKRDPANRNATHHERAHLVAQGMLDPRDKKGDGWPLAKSLAGIPEAFMLSLAYGYNVLDRHGPDSPAGRWRVRNVIVWARPNPPVGALGDKVRPATSYITVACTSGRRWFDLDAVRSDGSVNMKPRAGKKEIANPDRGTNTNGTGDNPAGAPPLDWWEDDDPTGHATLILPTQPYPGAHYATWPSTLAQRLIEMMCPRRVCTVCGEPSRRIVGDAEYVNNSGRPARYDMSAQRVAPGVRQFGGNGDNSAHRIAATLGWTDCGHDNWRNGHILDPFAGSGTTLAVATGLGRDATGIELYETNAELVRERCGLFLEVLA